ncbi:MFS transporter [Hespellia stercorisuis]|uniref:Major Facilitator Superfamily protein n=1 Tax=Hespellia stercorisuis DSM 15480 TaxID=1121950 RepID=A0A1M6TVP5_9FIRM|nr:MFS transporter [Hespellia stercorisuis]SHK60960.1 Major Facilitator Superfamily protein [Hespellia stercorisuis DSM 15480]
MKLCEKKSYPWILVIFYSLLGVTFPAAVTQFSMVVSDISDTMGLSRQQVLYADTTRAILLVAAMFLSSFIYQKLGLKKTMMLGMFFQISSQFLTPLAVNLGSFPLLLVFKGMQGLNAMAFPLYISSITLWMPDKYRGLATAIFNGSFVAGGGIGAWISGILVPSFGWQMSFYIIGGMCLLFAIPVCIITKDKAFEPDAHTATEKRSNIYSNIVHNPITWLLVLALIANTWVSQAITVDMSIYAQDIGYGYQYSGTLMLIISIVTVVSSILAGAVSDHFAPHSTDSVKTRSRIMGLGYFLATFAALLLPFVADNGFMVIATVSGAMMFGVSWSAGVFWALPSMVYAEKDNVAGTAFCSGASNVPNPVAPAVVGVLLGTNGHWTAGWITCAVVSCISLAASLLIHSPQSGD